MGNPAPTTDKGSPESGADKGSPLLLYLLPATALAAFPFFSNFTTPKLLLAGAVLSAAILRDRYPAIAVMRDRHPGVAVPRDRPLVPDAQVSGSRIPLVLLAAYLVLSIPAYLHAESAHDALQAIAMDLVGVVAYAIAFRGGTSTGGTQGRWPWASGAHWKHAGRSDAATGLNGTERSDGKPLGTDAGAGTAGAAGMEAVGTDAGAGTAGAAGMDAVGTTVGDGALAPMVGWGAVAVSVAVASALVVAFRIAEDLLPWPILSISALPGSSTLGNPDFVAEMAALGLVASAWGACRSVHGKELPCWSPVSSPPSGGSTAGRFGGEEGVAGSVFLLSLILSTYALIAIPSLTARAGAIAGLLALALLRLLGSRRLALVVLLALLACLAGAAYATGVLDDRLYLFEIGLTCGADNPILGHGVGSFAREFMERQGEFLAVHREASGLWTNATHAHNELLHQWVERGILPALACLAFIGWHIRVVALGSDRRCGLGLRPAPSEVAENGDCGVRKDGPDGAFSLRDASGLDVCGDGAVLAALLVVSLVLFSGSVGYTVVPMRIAFAMVLGAIAGRASRPARSQTSTVDPSAPTSKGHRPSTIDHRPSAVLSALGSTVAIAAAAFLFIYPLWSGSGDFSFTRGDVAGSLAVYPLNPRVKFFHAMDRMAKGDLAAACPELEETSHVYPNLSVLLAAGNCAYRSNDPDAALRWYQKAIRWKPTYSLAYANMALAYRAKGDDEAAWRHVVRAVSLAPSNPRVLAIRSAVCNGNRHCNK